MSLQTILNEQVFDSLPKIKEILKKSNQLEKDQIVDYTIRYVSNSSISLDNMLHDQVERLEQQLLAIFKEKKWLSEGINSD